MVNIILKLLSDIKIIIFSILVNWPSGEIGSFLRKIIFSKKMRKFGANTNIHMGVKITFPELVSLGSGCIVGEKVKIMPGDSNGIFIGDNTAIAENVYIRSANHSFENIEIPIKYQKHTCAKFEYASNFYSIVIEEDVWVGANAVILSGAFVGKGSVIGAGAVVSSKIQPYSIVVGNPGRVIGSRNK